MGVIMQAFYWDCPNATNKEYDWWNEVKGRVPSLAEVGFTALWLPPANKAANLGGQSMGYDPYDYYDLGEFTQKGRQETWFGSKADLVSLIGKAHDKGMAVYADMVLNHNSGADAQEPNPIDGTLRWTGFTPASKKFERHAAHFHPSQFETWDRGTYGDMPDLCHRAPYVYEQILEYARWLVEEVGFDGFRYDCVKGYGGWIITAIHERRYRGGTLKPFGVGECWDSDRFIEEWLDEANAWSDNPVSAFDFPLRDRLKDLCDCYGFGLRELTNPGTLSHSRPLSAVTFVENHDVARDNPVLRDKMLAYAYILTHEGYPCVFWQDYYEYDLGKEGRPDGIAALVRIHEDHAGGEADVLYVDDLLYVMQRRGGGGQRGLVLALNNSSEWRGQRVQTQWASKRFEPLAFKGDDRPYDQLSDASGSAEFWAPPRGYAVYVPK